jgi:metal-responsive CopG/Arc/MetJ family transcriptional regulator
VLLKGKVSDLRHIASSLASLKGVKHSKLVLTSTEKSKS